MSSTTLPSAYDSSLSGVNHLCDECSNMGHEIKQLCEGNNLEIRKSRVSVQRNRSICAFCEVIASHFRLESGEDEGDFKIHNADIYGLLHGLNIWDGERPGFQHLELDVFTMEGLKPILLSDDRKIILRLIMDSGSIPATTKHITGRCIRAASNLDQARNWLDNCLLNHNHGSNAATTRPARLVAVGAADGSEFIRIVNGSDADKEYLAVSYRWGNETLLTTTETLEPFHTSIPWVQLPQTFKDAIFIARQLGIGHVWIDSLCIIQDKLDDWEIESAKMADIYKSALLTIMAASASDSQGGLFRYRHTTKELAVLPYTDASGATQFSVLVRKALPYYQSFISTTQLFRRGWVFQERLMSRRKLIFGKDQTYWECSDVVQSESKKPNQPRHEAWRTRITGTFRAFSDPICKAVGVDHDGSPEFLWETVVLQYSPCALTYEADRLPALSGLARTFARRFGGTYAAGLWKEHMPNSLLWYVSSGRSRATCKGEYCAPSWSWASTMDQVVFHGYGGNSELEIISINIKLAGQDPYGRVCPGSCMCVRGRLRSGRMVKGERYGPAVCLKTGHKLWESRICMDRDNKDLPVEVVYLEVTSGNGKRHDIAICLLLRGTGADKHFRRVGLATLEPVRRDEEYLFHGLHKEVITLV